MCLALSGQSTIGNLLAASIGVNLRLMPKDFICVQCDQIEKRCSCTKYCWLCRAQFDVRLCEDGQYYCRPCRESCDMQAQYHSNA